jgi:glycogen debranching enzyme
LRARADGLIDADILPAFPIMAPRLQGELVGDGTLRLSIWGTGEVGRLRVAGLQGPFVAAPNRLQSGDGGGLWAAQSAPALALRGGRPEQIHLDRAGHFAVEARSDGAWVVAGGMDQAELARGLALDVATIQREADEHVARCDLMPTAAPLLRSLVMQGAHAGLSSIRCYPGGHFAGLSAGLAYSTPARTYYRDGYWTMPLLLRLAPDVVAAEIDLLATCVQADGEAPSGVIVQGPHAASFEALRLAEPAMAAIHWRPGEWWSDHFDSPLLFVIAVGEYVAASGDTDLALRHWTKLLAVFRRYMALRGPEGLPVKPRNDRDWADNVYRQGLVSYDLGLWVGALDVVSRLGARIDTAVAAEAAQVAGEARAAIDRLLRRDGVYVDYLRSDGWAEPHVTLDALTLLRFDAVSEEHALVMLEHVRVRLESRRNVEQPYGDFGMLCVWPPFRDRGALRAKSAFPYRYHNGGDWPWLDGLYAAERLRRGLDGWRYPLTRWWEACLERGWAGPVEHFSAPFGRGSLLQAWSSLPAAVALTHVGQELGGDPDET